MTFQNFDVSRVSRKYLLPSYVGGTDRPFPTEWPIAALFRTRTGKEKGLLSGALESGRRGLNPRPTRWERVALPLSYARIAGHCS